MSIHQKDNTFASSTYVWAKDLPPSRNQFVSFERRFVCEAGSPAVLHVFADTRYRLFVNETFVAYGPGRFVTAYPEFDSHDLDAHLTAGENLIRVEVNYYGCTSYQTMPDGRPGFIALGGLADGTVDFATPGTWMARVHYAWDANSPHFSFAQNPVEICDTRVLANELAGPASHPVDEIASASTPWPKPVRRYATYSDYALVRPERLLVVGPVADSLRWGMQMQRSKAVASGQPHDKEFRSFATWIYSPRDRRARLECFWIEAEINGQPLDISYETGLGNHGCAAIFLKEGWNFLGGNVELLADYWPFLLGLPRDAGASLHSLPDLACAEAFSLSAPVSERSIPPCPASPAGYVLPEGWTGHASDLARVTPSRLMAWDHPDEVLAQRDLDVTAVATQTVRAAIWSFDFGDEYYGHPVIEVDAPCGSVLDVAYDDWKRADGCVNLYGSNPFIEAADRFILRGGRQRIEVLNPRGGIYLQIVLRAPKDSEPLPLILHDVAIRRRTTLNRCTGAFVSGDPVLDWAWRTSVHTLQASTDEAYADCPWRERGSYIGDSLVNFHLNRVLTADLTPAKRTFETFGRAQRPDGQLQGCAPSWLTQPHDDFTLIWVLAVRDYWAYTGDILFAAAQLPVMERIFASATWNEDSSGLWDMSGHRAFLDWGVERDEREGAGNAALNVFRVAALRCAAEVATACGHPDLAVRFLSEADRVAQALSLKLWNDAKGRFDASIGATTEAVHANVLALRFGIGPADRILAYLEPRLHDNFTLGMGKASATGYVELYFFHYLLPALVKHGRAELADDLVRQHYGFIKSLGYPTLPENFHDAARCHGSCCHSWSGSAAIYATDYVLGLRLVVAGQPDHYVVSPLAPKYSHVEGTLPHRLGPIRLRWERNAGRIAAHALVPDGVTLTADANVDLVIDRRF